MSAADDPVPFPDMAIKIGEILDDGYYDKARFHPVVMVERALRALTSTEMTIATKWTGGAIALSTASELPAEALEYAGAHGFAVSEMTVGDGVRWTSGVAVPS